MKRNNLRDLRGIKQEDLAQLLQVSRSQLSLYEIGKRSLQMHALEKLSTPLSHLQANKNQDNLAERSNTSEEEQLFEKLLIKNSRQQFMIEKKIKAFQKKQNALAVSTTIINLMIKDTNATNKKELVILKNIAAKNETQKKQTSRFELTQLELKKRTADL